MKTTAQKIKTLANSIARKYGCGVATSISVADTTCVRSLARSGYRKNTTDEYVSNAYRRNFGWTNTYYQQAEADVTLSADDITHALWRTDHCGTLAGLI